ncbi:MAG: sigma-70 family RNA polymerase sigma factor [Pseudomonadota bacterium]
MASLTQIEILLPELRAYALTLCLGHHADAEDLVQDAVERALRAETRPAKLVELRPWIIRVIRNLHYDELRKRRVRREYSAAEKRLMGEGSFAANVDRDVLIRLAFEKLPAEKREILYLVDILEFKYADAAWVLDVPKGTVMSRISRARAALLALVDGKAGSDDQTGQSEELGAREQHRRR